MTSMLTVAMIEIDGRSGGGQMLRTALTLSAVTGRSFRMKNIRGSRRNPGLKDQHVTAIKAAAALSSAEIKQMQRGSEEVEFHPEQLSPRDLELEVGTAGSVNLVLDTVLPLATQFEQSLRFDIYGGTDVRWSPTSLYMKEVKLPLLRKYGFRGKLEYLRHGFYPEGGGHVRFTSENCSLETIDILERGEKLAAETRRISTGESGTSVESDSEGAAVLEKIEYAKGIAGFDNVGEDIQEAEKGLEGIESFSSGVAPIDPYMGDQLMIYLALVGGRYLAPELTPHMETNISVIRKFGNEIVFEEREEGVYIEI